MLENSFYNMVTTPNTPPVGVKGKPLVTVLAVVAIGMVGYMAWQGWQGRQPISQYRTSILKTLVMRAASVQDVSVQRIYANLRKRFHVDRVGNLTNDDYEDVERYLVNLL